MGKYPNSDLHDKYSDFHWSLIKLNPKYKRLYCADIDRQWIEYDFKTEEVVAIIDIKKKQDLLREELGFSPTEKGIYEWYEQRKVCCPVCKNSFIEKSADVFVVYISKNFHKFYIKPFKEDKIYILKSQTDYADWLLSLREHKNFLQRFESYQCEDLIKKIKIHKEKQLEFKKLDKGD